MRRARFPRSPAFCLLALAALALGASSPPPAERIFRGGPIVTLDPSQPSAGALAVRAGRIVAVGGELAVMRLRGPHTEVVELGGAALLPGLVEAHTHPVGRAVLAQWVDGAGFRHETRSAVADALRAAAERADPGAWVLAFGLDPVLVADYAPPTRAELDAIAPENPLFVLTQMMHVGYANSRALAAAGIGRETPNPRGGAFPKDPRGEPTGEIVEVPALGRFLAGLPRAPREAHRAAVDAQLRRYAEAGYTTIVNPGQVSLVAEPARLLQEAADAPDAPVRVHAFLLPDAFAGFPLGPGFGSTRFRVRGVKLWVDGSPYAGGMATAAPYLDSALAQERLGIEPGSRGHLNYTDAELEAAIEAVHVRGFQVALHTQGERAIDQALGALERVLAKHPRADARHRLEHLALATPEQLGRAKRLELGVSFFTNHVHWYGAALRDAIVGPERAARFMPMRSALQAGLRTSLHTDNPASPLDAMAALATAVTRHTRADGEVLGATQRLTVDEALRAMTLDAAWQVFAEDEIGSLEVGKRADLTVLSRDPRVAPPEAIREIGVLETWLDGRRVFRRP